jgi:hypothetical protein
LERFGVGYFVLANFHETKLADLLPRNGLADTWETFKRRAGGGMNDVMEAIPKSKRQTRKEMAALWYEEKFEVFKKLRARNWELESNPLKRRGGRTEKKVKSN